MDQYLKVAWAWATWACQFDLMAGTYWDLLMEVSCPCLGPDLSGRGVGPPQSHYLQDLFR